MSYNYKVREDKDDARRMSEGILRSLGYINSGSNDRSVSEELQPNTLLEIARNAERIARWARQAAKEYKP